MALLLVTSACGSAPPADGDAVFRRIQVHEAVIAHQAAQAAECAPEQPCPAARAVCRAAEDLCIAAGTIVDADAETRCTLARRRCGAQAGERAGDGGEP